MTMRKLFVNSQYRGGLVVGAIVRFRSVAENIRLMIDDWLGCAYLAFTVVLKGFDLRVKFTEIMASMIRRFFQR